MNQSFPSSSGPNLRRRSQSTANVSAVSMDWMLQEVLGLFGGVEVARVHAVGHEQERKDHRGGEHERRRPSRSCPKTLANPPRHVPPLAHGVEVERRSAAKPVALDRVLDDVEGVLAGTHGEGGLRRGNVDALAPQVALELLVLALVFAGRARHATRSHGGRDATPTQRLTSGGTRAIAVRARARRVADVEATSRRARAKASRRDADDVASRGHPRRRKSASARARRRHGADASRADISRAAPVRAVERARAASRVARCGAEKSGRPGTLSRVFSPDDHVVATWRSKLSPVS